MRKLTLQERIVIFKIIGISKIVFQAFITTVSKHIINELKKICNDYKAGGLKNIDIPNKIIAP